MKKNYIFLALMLTSFLGFSQTSKFLVTLNEPVANATLTQGTPFDQKFVITVQGTTPITPGDTIAYVDPSTPSGQVFIKTNLTKAVNDTIQINKTLNITGGSGGVVNYCVIAFMFSAGGIKTGFDTTGFRSCKSVTIVTTPAGIGEVTYSDAPITSKLSIFPNPAIGNSISFDYITLTNNELVANVFDIAGRKVMSHSYGQQRDNQTGFKLDISSLNQGLYIVELRQGSYKSTGQLIKE